MASYPRLTELVMSAPSAAPTRWLLERAVPYLVDVWMDDYGKLTAVADVVETRASDFSYLFDVAEQRLIAAWGISKGRYGGPRDHSRMAGHPLSAGPRFHRGHAIPHTLGGPADINLVPQSAKVNVGAFRALERRAVATPGSLYFTYWIYRFGGTQIPSAVDQGLLVAGAPPNITAHGN